MIEGLRGERLRFATPRGLRLGGVEAGRGLHQRVEAAPFRPWAFMPVGGERDIDDPWAEPRDLAGAEAESRERAGPIALHEDVGTSDELAKPRACRLIAQIEPSRELAAAGVDRERQHGGQMRGG